MILDAGLWCSIVTPKSVFKQFDETKIRALIRDDLPRSLFREILDNERWQGPGVVGFVRWRGHVTACASESEPIAIAWVVDTSDAFALFGVFVHPAHRRRRHASVLFDIAKRFSEAPPNARTLYVHPPDEVAKAFFRSVGVYEL